VETHVRLVLFLPKPCHFDGQVFLIRVLGNDIGNGRRLVRKHTTTTTDFRGNIFNEYTALRPGHFRTAAWSPNRKRPLRDVFAHPVKSAYAHRLVLVRVRRYRPICPPLPRWLITRDGDRLRVIIVYYIAHAAVVGRSALCRYYYNIISRARTATDARANTRNNNDDDDNGASGYRWWSP